MQNVLLVHASLSFLGQTQVDEEISEEVRTQHGVSKEGGRWNKVKWPKAEIKDMQTAKGRFYSEFKKCTVPFLGKGIGLLNAAAFDQFKRRMDRAIEAYHETVRQFCANYQEHLREAAGALNGTFKQEDYEPPEHIMQTCRAQYRPLPLPQTGAWQLLQAAVGEHTAELQAQHAAAVQDAERRASVEPYRRLVEHLDHMATTLANDPKRIFESLKGNVLDVLDRMPMLQLGEVDPELSAIAGEVRRKMDALNIESLKGNAVAQKDTAKVAAGLVAAFRGALGRKISK